MYTYIVLNEALCKILDTDKSLALHLLRFLAYFKAEVDSKQQKMLQKEEFHPPAHVIWRLADTVGGLNPQKSATNKNCQQHRFIQAQLKNFI